MRQAFPRIADAAVNLRDLVTHRTGVRGHDLLWYRSPLPQEEIIRRVAYLKPDKPFRSSFQYQSTMFTTAGRAVASASGTPWGDRCPGYRRRSRRYRRWAG